VKNILNKINEYTFYIVYFQLFKKTQTTWKETSNYMWCNGLLMFPHATGRFCPTITIVSFNACYWLLDSTHPSTPSLYRSPLSQCHSPHPGDGGSKIPWNIGILLQHYTASELKGPRLGSLLQQKRQILHCIKAYSISCFILLSIHYIEKHF